MFPLPGLFPTLLAIGHAANPTGRRLDDERRKFMALVDFGPFATSLTFAQDVLSFDNQLGLGILAFSTQDKLVDEHVEQILEFVLVVSAVDDVSLRGPVANDFSLRAKFKTKEFGEVDGRTAEVVGDVQHIGDDCLDTIALAFDLEKCD